MKKAENTGNYIDISFSNKRNNVFLLLLYKSYYLNLVTFAVAPLAGAWVEICPNCSAGLEFNSKTQKMACEYCGNSYTVEELEELEEQKEEPLKEEDSRGHWEGFDPESWNPDGGEISVWSCPSCGAELVAEKTAGALVCPYCMNSMIMPEQFQDIYRPDYVIPFKKSKKDALDALKKHYLKKPLLPSVFKDENHLEEIKAVYVPFWMYDLESSGRFQYQGTRVRFWETEKYECTETSFYHIVRKGSMKFCRIPVDGSEKIDDTMMEAIEPYDYQELEPFQLSYLSGYMADRYDREPDELTDRVHARMEESMRRAVRNTVIGYDTVIPVQEDIRITGKGQVKYALLPVWFLNTKWNGKTYSFAMNGQTGKIIGDLPVGKDLLIRYWMKYHIFSAAVIFVLFVILMLAGVIG